MLAPSCVECSLRLGKGDARLASCSGGILAGSTGECWRAAPAGYWPDVRQDPPARDTQRDTWRDPLASYSEILNGILGRIHWRAALPLASRSGGILGGIHWRAALAGYWAGSILGGIHCGELLWRDHWRDALAGYWVGAWCRSIAHADSNIKSINPFLSGGEKHNFFASSNPHPPHSRAYDREHGCVSSSIVFEWLGAYDCSTTLLHLSASRSNIGSVNKSQAPSKKKPDGFNQVAYSQPKATQQHHPFRASGYTQNTKAPT